MKLGNIRLHEIFQTKRTNIVRLHVGGGTQNTQINRDRKQNKGYQGLEQGGVGSYCLIDTEMVNMKNLGDGDVGCKTL